LLTYQWLFNSGTLNGATNSILILTNILPGQVGDYTIVVANLAGSISSDAQLAIALPPITLTVSGTNFSVSLTSETGLNYTLQYTDDLAAPNWTSILPSTPGTGGIIHLSDPSPSPTARFYRVFCD
jgi:hypothetical protein